MAGRILIAGGDPALRIGLRARLGAACHEVEQVQATPAAVRLARRMQPDIVIALASPHDPAAAFLCREMRANPLTRQAGIVAVVAGGGDRRLGALRAGADDALSQPLDNLLLLARIRQLLVQPRPMLAATGLAEAPAPFGPPPLIALIGPDSATAIGWRHALAPLVSARLQTMTPARALQDTAQARGADLYVIAGDLAQGEDGLRLMSELRSRPASRDAAFVIALAPEKASMAPIALDLGAGDVLPLGLRAPDAADEAALRLGAQLALRSRMLEQRREAERHRHWAMTDPLTGLANRRHALPRLDAMLAESLRLARPLAVMVLDLDHFKAVNDRHGHAAGDMVLREIAQRLTQTLQPEDLLARIGGEEFLIARQGADRAGVLALAETLRRHVAHPSIRLPGPGDDTLHITASIGLALTDAADLAANPPPAGEALIARADQALLAAKANGRDRILLAPMRAAA